ncbi:VOC family protein [Listeria monocytogenes]|uniref:Catechol-2,3-dioxygenase n=2 Tax=Listeria monocytogenes TaxID=1639 RepID=A0A1T1YRF4_LISMN|nr:MULTISPECIES: VOC family protein [Listeria]EAE3704304.1 VOC family protein [Listeria monocytogenes serotype 1/2b]EAF3077278.1 VOC family protein [Listeria monocytogenes serotype 1/2a]EAG6252209.1 VOC family protein [Listeria monocytogenes CFSAN003806]EAG6261558.1 VOC family protein [Listeria monocytogenes CFSAN003725]EAG6331251.1 VOC family protein [Listeria monocytogenes CFSAN002346]EAG6350448.1 VOC family protein [Listeria monocytogenes LIS0102]EAG6364219.1 VOC family protein [Listeria 
MAEISEELRLGEVVLNVGHLKEMAGFYQEVIGLKLLEENERMVRLGVSGSDEALLVLKKIDNAVVPEVPRIGLFHTAFLLPTRESLADVLLHLAKSGYPIDGAGDHAYSEALYLHDIEGNGIEIYADRPKAEWMRDGDGNLPMVTEQVDVDSLLQIATDEPFTGMPNGTIIGHVHLQVADADKAEQFYKEVLGMNLTTAIPSARFFAAGDYHHHIGSNVWAGRNLELLQENETGLAWFTIITPDKDAIITNLIEQGYDVKRLENTISVTDSNGIKIHFK